MRPGNEPTVGSGRRVFVTEGGVGLPATSVIVGAPVGTLVGVAATGAVEVDRPGARPGLIGWPGAQAARKLTHTNGR